jgi:GntR family transcriptional regulator
VTSENGWVSSSLAYVAPSATGEDAWAQEAAAQHASGTQKLTYAGVTAAPSAVVTALGLDGDAPQVVVRRRLILLDGAPVELADTYYPLRVASGTALEQPRKIRGGAIAVLAELGWTAARVQEDVTARMAAPDELEALALTEPEPVIVLERVSFGRGDEPIQADVMVAPARLRRLRYELKVA